MSENLHLQRASQVIHNITCLESTAIAPTQVTLLIKEAYILKAILEF